MSQKNKDVRFFYNFLVAHNAFNAYCRNVRKLKSIAKWKRDTIDSDNVESKWIDYAFCWAETPQGHEYWRKLDMLWRKRIVEQYRHSRIHYDYYKFLLD